MPTYKRSMFDRLGPDGPAIFRSVVWAVFISPMGGLIGATAGIKFGLDMTGIVLLFVAGSIVGGLAVYLIMKGLPGAGGATMQAIVFPSGNTTPYETDFSYESALAMKGDLKGALASFEEKITANPTAVPVRLKAAEMYLSAGKPERARELYREVQRIPGVERRDDVFASYRLIDLYRGKLGEPNKSLPEFRRLIERYPGTQIEQQARDALAHLKKEISFEQ